MAPLSVTPDDVDRRSAADHLSTWDAASTFAPFGSPATITEGRSTSDTTTGDSSPQGSIVGGGSALDTVTGDDSALDTETEDDSALDAFAEDAPAVDTNIEDDSALDTVADDDPALDAVTGDSSAVDSSAVDSSAVDSSAVDSVAEDAVETTTPRAEEPSSDEASEAAPSSDPALQSMDELSAFLAELRASQASGPRLRVEPYPWEDRTEQDTPRLPVESSQTPKKCEEYEKTQASTGIENSESVEVSEKNDVSAVPLAPDVPDTPQDPDEEPADPQLTTDRLEGSAEPSLPPLPETDDPHDTPDSLAPADPLDPSDAPALSDSVDSSATDAPEPDNIHPNYPEDDQAEDIQPEDDQAEDDRPEHDQVEQGAVGDDKAEDDRPEHNQVEHDPAGDDQLEDDQLQHSQAGDDQAEHDQIEDRQFEDHETEDHETEDAYDRAEDDQAEDDRAEDGQAEDGQAEDGQPGSESAETDSSEQDVHPGSQATGAHATTTADPEQVLAAYPWRFDGETLREVVDDPAGLRSVRERLTRKLTAADNDGARARLLSLRAVVSRVLGDLDEALADGREALAYARATGELRRTAIAQARLAHVLQWRGEFAEADRLFAQADSVELPDRLRAAMHEHSGRCSYDQGRYLEACHHLERAMELRRVEDLTLIARIEATLDAIAARVRRDGWGPYPRSREEILQLHSPPVPSFDENLRRWGYADEQGAVVMPHRYAEAQPFHEGVAWVRLPAARAWELIDEAGTVLLGVAAGYRRVGAYSEGLAWVSHDDAGGWFAIDRWGWIVVPGGFDEVHPFRRDLAAVRQGGWGAVDRRGRVVVAPRYRGFTTELADGTRIDGFTDEGLAVIDAGDRKGVVDRHGRLIVAPVHAQLVVHPVAFLIGDRGGRWGALDRRGELLIDVGYADRGEVLDEIDRLLADTRPVL